MLGLDGRMRPSPHEQKQVPRFARNDKDIGYDKTIYETIKE